MAFSSFDFIFFFLPVFLLFYYMVPARMRTVCLFLGSAVFYLWGIVSAPLGTALISVLLLIGATVLTYFSGIAMERDEKHDPALPGVVLVVLFAALLFFKYSGLFLDAPLALPLGISFYMFSMASYVLDIFWGRRGAEHSFLRYGTYVTMFPKLLSGPIATYGEIGGEMGEIASTESRLRFSRFDRGLRTFLYGLALKVLLANRLSGLWNEAAGIGYESLSVPMAWLCVLAFSLQLYFDFWGYSLMAMGVGEMLGYTLPLNFDHPYAAKSMTDFWRRWHMTLGMWFRNYLYIPLGGSRCSKGRMVFNLFVVWLATGIWHGATVNFLLWAGFIFVFIIAEKLLYGRFLEKSRVLCHIYMVPLILVSWLLFAVTDTGELFVYLRRLFDVSTPGVNPTDYLLALRDYGGYLLAGIVMSIPVVPRFFEKKLRDTSLGTLILLVLFVWCLYAMAMGQNDPFLYFGF